jgi:2-methylcitrate dehydratase PrpD
MQRPVGEVPALLAEVSDFVLGLRLEDVPRHVRQRLRSLLVDHAAVCAAGRNAPAAKLAADYATLAHAGDEATALLDGRRLAAPGAAWANGVLANVLDYDDGHRLAKGHPGAIVVPAAVAVGQRSDASLDELATAILLGYEVALRAAVRQHDRMPLYHASGSWGALGAAAAAGRLLGLSRAQLGHALGLAEYHAPIAPMSRAVTDPAMTKDATGWGALIGVSAALLAGQGYTSLAPTFLDGPSLELHRRWDILDVYVKPYPCCRWTQPAIDAALQLRRALAGRTGTTIERVVIETFAAAGTLSRRHPTTTEELQYSLTWPVAIALVEGRFGVDEVLNIPVGEQAASLERSIVVEVDDELTAEFPAVRLSQVVLELDDGMTLRSGRIEAGGEPDSAGWQGVVDAKALLLPPFSSGTTRSLGELDGNGLLTLIGGDIAAVLE